MIETACNIAIFIILPADPLGRSSSGRNIVKLLLYPRVIFNNDRALTGIFSMCMRIYVYAYILLNFQICHCFRNTLLDF